MYATWDEDREQDRRFGDPCATPYYSKVDWLYRQSKSPTRLSLFNKMIAEVGDQLDGAERDGGWWINDDCMYLFDDTDPRNFRERTEPLTDDELEIIKEMDLEDAADFQKYTFDPWIIEGSITLNATVATSELSSLEDDIDSIVKEYGFYD